MPRRILMPLPLMNFIKHRFFALAPILMSVFFAAGVRAQSPTSAATRPATAPSTRPANPTGISQEPGGDIPEKEVMAIPFEEFAMDRGFVGAVTPGLDHLDEDRRKQFDEWAAKLDDWKPGKTGSVGQRVRNFLTLAALADMGRSEFEGETAYAVFEKLKREFSKDQLIRACAWVALRPKEGDVFTSAPEVGFEGDVSEEELRDRTTLFAVKLLGRAMRKLPPKRADDAPGR